MQKISHEGPKFTAVVNNLSRTAEGKIISAPSSKQINPTAQWGNGRFSLGRGPAGEHSMKKSRDFFIVNPKRNYRPGRHDGVAIMTYESGIPYYTSDPYFFTFLPTPVYTNSVVIDNNGYAGIVNPTSGNYFIDSEGNHIVLKPVTAATVATDSFDDNKKKSMSIGTIIAISLIIIFVLAIIFVIYNKRQITKGIYDPTIRYSSASSSRVSSRA